MNDLIKENNVKIENMIYEIRGMQVMLDSDLAKLYQCNNGTKDINKAVSRNINRFPKDFYFQLTKEEYEYILKFKKEILEIRNDNDLKFQNGTSNINSHGGVRKIPYVFTEQGCAMISSVLKI